MVEEQRRKEVLYCTGEQGDFGQTLHFRETGGRIKRSISEIHQKLSQFVEVSVCGSGNQCFLLGVFLRATRAFFAGVF